MKQRGSLVARAALAIVTLSGALGACGDSTPAATGTSTSPATTSSSATTTTTSTTGTTSTTSSSTTTTDCSPDCPPAPPLDALGTVMLGLPTATSITVSVLPKAALEIAVEYGPADGDFPSATPPVITSPGVPVAVVLGGLAPDAAHHYRVRFRAPGGAFATAPEQSFHTQRAPGAAFTFTIQADSHRDENSDLDLYRTALANIRADHADFHVDLGDTFMTEKFAKTNADVVARYVEERSWFSAITDTVPLFLVNGNHEGELGWLLEPTGDDEAVWSAKARLAYYLNPLPDGFYKGNAADEPFVGKRGGYYAFEWGDALFVMLDPFWFTTKRPSKVPSDGWIWTLGEAQYHFLEEALLASKARFKFVFSHHIVGGLNDARGGVEVADKWEWGGRNQDGVDEFAAKRPGWARPIHALLKEAKVSAWFHGHDHLYVTQEKDGIVYQEVPQPSHRGDNGAQTAKQWGYSQGTILSSSGHIRVSVAPTGVKAEYVQAFLPADETPKQKNGQVGHSYVIPAP